MGRRRPVLDNAMSIRGNRTMKTSVMKNLNPRNIRSPQINKRTICIKFITGIRSRDNGRISKN
jgi:hypothetical protein